MERETCSAEWFKIASLTKRDKCEDHIPRAKLANNVQQYRSAVVLPASTVARKRRDELLARRETNY